MERIQLSVLTLDFEVLTTLNKQSEQLIALSDQEIEALTNLTIAGKTRNLLEFTTSLKNELNQRIKKLHELCKQYEHKKSHTQNDLDLQHRRDETLAVLKTGNILMHIENLCHRLANVGTSTSERQTKAPETNTKKIPQASKPKSRKRRKRARHARRNNASANAKQPVKKPPSKQSPRTNLATEETSTTPVFADTEKAATAPANSTTTTGVTRHPPATQRGSTPSLQDEYWLTLTMEERLAVFFNQNDLFKKIGDFLFGVLKQEYAAMIYFSNAQRSLTQQLSQTGAQHLQSELINIENGVRIAIQRISTHILLIKAFSACFTYTADKLLTCARELSKLTFSYHPTYEDNLLICIKTLADITAQIAVRIPGKEYAAATAIFSETYRVLMQKISTPAATQTAPPALQPQAKQTFAIHSPTVASMSNAQGQKLLALIQQKRSSTENAAEQRLAEKKRRIEALKAEAELKQVELELKRLERETREEDMKMQEIEARQAALEDISSSSETTTTSTSDIGVAGPGTLFHSPEAHTTHADIMRASKDELCEVEIEGKFLRYYTRPNGREIFRYCGDNIYTQAGIWAEHSDTCEFPDGTQSRILSYQQNPFGPMILTTSIAPGTA